MRASIARASSAALDEIGRALSEPIGSISLRTWPPDFTDDIAVQRRAPFEARADAIMYRQVLSELAHARGWEVYLYDAKAVQSQAVHRLAERADEILHGPRTTLGPPWAKDHRVALAATIIELLNLAQHKALRRDRAQAPSRSPSKKAAAGESPIATAPASPPPQYDHGHGGRTECSKSRAGFK